MQGVLSLFEHLSLCEEIQELRSSKRSKNYMISTWVIVADHAWQVADHAEQVADHAWQVADHAEKVADHAWQVADLAWQHADHAWQVADHA